RSLPFQAARDPLFGAVSRLPRSDALAGCRAHDVAWSAMGAPCEPVTYLCRSGVVSGRQFVRTLHFSGSVNRGVSSAESFRSPPATTSTAGAIARPPPELAPAEPRGSLPAPSPSVLRGTGPATR